MHGLHSIALQKPLAQSLFAPQAWLFASLQLPPALQTFSGAMHCGSVCPAGMSLQVPK
jgi:hypothetical protein